MPATIGYHIVVSGYGLWLPGDMRGHWSDAWDEQIGYHSPHTLHPGDPVRSRMAEERMKHPLVRLNAAMTSAAIAALTSCVNESEWGVEAASVESTHIHLLVTYSRREIDLSVKWLKDQMTKAIHRATPHQGPVWCKGRWRGFMFDELMWDNARAYIEAHNVRRGEGPRPYGFVRPQFLQNPVRSLHKAATGGRAGSESPG